MSTWNINGWTENNKNLRQGILRTLEHDIYCLTETHLKHNDNITLPGYTWFGYNRTFVHVRARKGSGGTGILVKNSLFNVFDINVIDKTFDGIIGIRIVDKISEHSFVIFSCYLPPDNSLTLRM